MVCCNGKEGLSVPAVDDAARLSGATFAVAIAAERYELCGCVSSAERRRE